MSKLVAPHGGKGLVCALLSGSARDAELKKAAGLKQIEISARAKGDLIMMGIGGFSPLSGFMTKADWKGVCEKFQMADGTSGPFRSLWISLPPMQRPSRKATRSPSYAKARPLPP